MRGIAEARKKTEAEVRALIDEGPFLPEDALRAGLVDEVAYEDQVDARSCTTPARRRRATIDGERLRARQRCVARPEPRPAHRRHLRRRRDRRAGESGFDPVNGASSARTRSSSTSAQARRDRSIRAIVLRIDSPGGSATASDAIWRELMIAKQRARRPADRRVDVRSRRVGRLLHRDARAGHRRAAVDAHRLDRHLRRQVRHRRRLREARREHRVDEHRPARRDEFAGASVQRRRSSRSCEEQLQAFYDQFVEKVADVAAQRRRRRSTRSRRAASGPASRRRRTAWWTRSAASTAAIALAKERAKIAADERRGARASIRRAKSFYELLSEQLSGAAAGGGRAWLSANLSSGELRGAARAARPVRDVPARRAAGADAVYVLTMSGARGLRAQELAQGLRPCPEP